MGRSSGFNDSIRDYLGGSESSTEPTDDFDLPEEKKPYYDAMEEGAKHRERMAAMKPAERNEYQRGLREGMYQGQPQKRGGIDNPLKKDMPRQPRAPKPGHEVRQAKSRMAQIGKLARLASGKKR
jgi:hypothetical protein